MDRRKFLTLLSSAIVASTNPVHFLAPLKGWRQSEGGLHLPSHSLKNIAEVPDEILISPSVFMMIATGKALDDIARMHGLYRHSRETDGKFRERLIKGTWTI